MRPEFLNLLGDPIGVNSLNEFRRLSDKIILAHKQACDEGKQEVATLLLQALEFDLSQFGGKLSENRQATEMLEAAFALHEKLMSNS